MFFNLNFIELMEVITLNKETISINCAELNSKFEVQTELVIDILIGSEYIVSVIK